MTGLVRRRVQIENQPLAYARGSVFRAATARERPARNATWTRLLCLCGTGILACVGFSQQAPDAGRDANPTAETRYSLSLTDEGAYAAGLRVPGPDTGNLLLLQPSFSYRDGDRWRFSTSLAALAETNGDTHVQGRVRETYLALSAGDFDFLAGKRLLRWGTGYAFTATGILDPPRIATDPTDRLNLNQGREMVQADWIHGGNDITVAWASAGLLDSHRPGMRETTAVRCNRLIDGFDTAVIVAHDRGGPSFAGGNFTRVFGEAVEVHGEFAWREGAALLAGGKYTTRSGVQLMAEFYTPPDTAYYRPAGMPAGLGRQHYGFARAAKSRVRERPGWKQWDVAAAIVANLDDRSSVAVFDAGRRIGNNFYAYTHAQAPRGKQWRSQYGMIPYAALVSIGLTVQL
jgi:hypothetical protein